ncbi:MAG: histidine kinase [Candidatus Dormiibacterota bacterium]
MIYLFARWNQRRRIAILGVVALLIAIDEVEQPHVEVAVLALTGVMLVGLMAQAVRSHPLWLALIAGSALALVVVNYGQAGVAAVLGVVFTLIYLAHYPREWGLPVAVVLIAAFVTLDRIHSPGEALAGTLLNIIAMSAGYGVSYGFRRLQREQARTRAALEELRAAREGQLEAARTEERAHLAREIHDVLAHTLSALAVQVEAAKLMLETHTDEPRALQSLDRAHRLAQEGLQEVRRAVGALRGESLPGPEALPDLVRSFAADSGIACRLEVEGAPVRLGPEAGLAVFRTAQEALTNVRRHADAAEVALHLAYLGERGAELVVEDRGRPKAAASSGGYGSPGIRERAELLGGSLEAGPIAGGFRVRLRVPAEPAAAMRG